MKVLPGRLWLGYGPPPSCWLAPLRRAAILVLDRGRAAWCSPADLFSDEGMLKGIIIEAKRQRIDQREQLRP
ncbi:MAG TPA: hypothetical protein VEK34_06800 [Methylocella sp.]|nr:hypothetical protein [Methylocella sp.]